MLSMHGLSLSMSETMLSLSMLILPTYPVAALQFETKIKTDIPKFQHVDFLWFCVVLAYFGQMFSASTGGGELD